MMIKIKKDKINELNPKIKSKDIVTDCYPKAGD